MLLWLGIPKSSFNSIGNGNDNTCIIEEKLTALMKKILAEESKKQQQSLLKLISGNFQIAIKEIKNIKSEVNELKENIEFTEVVLEEKVRICRGKLVA